MPPEAPDSTQDPAEVVTPPAAPAPDVPAVPTAPSTPTPNDVAPQSTPVVADPEDGSDPSEDETDSGDSGDLGFPAHTAVKDMTDAQKAAYWRNVAKVKQKELKQFKKEHNVSTPTPPAVPTPPAPDAPQEPQVPSTPPAPATDAAMNRRILIAEVRASIPSLSREDISNTVDLLDVQKFFKEDGDLNEEAVNTLVGRMASNPSETFRHSPAADIFGGGAGSPHGSGGQSITALASRRQAELAAAKAPRQTQQ